MSLLTRRRALLSAKGKVLLPKEYQQVEYLESTHNEYIDTNVYIDLTTRVEIDAQFLKYYHWDDNNVNFLAGVRDYNGGIKGRFEIAYGKTSQKVYLNMGDTTNTRILTDITCDFKRHKYIADAVSKTMTMDNGILLSYIENNTIENWVTSTAPFRLFGSSFSTRYLSVMKMYGVKFYKNDVLVGDYIPCYRKADNAAGLYDLVNSKFFIGKGNGNSKFILGGEV